MQTVGVEGPFGPGVLYDVVDLFPVVAGFLAFWCIVDVSVRNDVDKSAGRSQ